MQCSCIKRMNSCHCVVGKDVTPTTFPNSGMATNNAVNWGDGSTTSTSNMQFPKMFFQTGGLTQAFKELDRDDSGSLNSTEFEILFHFINKII